VPDPVLVSKMRDTTTVKKSNRKKVRSTFIYFIHHVVGFGNWVRNPIFTNLKREVERKMTWLPK
jgi:hypothetical protein